MRTLFKAAFPFVLAACVGPAQANGPAGVEALAWMAGSWGSQPDGAWVEEHWLAPRGGIMLGTNRSGDKDGAKAFEFLRISAGPDGVPIYWAAPAGAPAKPFRQIESEPGSVTFENQANAYPTRIRYRRSGDALEATIEAASTESVGVTAWGILLSCGHEHRTI